MALLLFGAQVQLNIFLAARVPAGLASLPVRAIGQTEIVDDAMASLIISINFSRHNKALSFDFALQVRVEYLQLSISSRFSNFVKVALVANLGLPERKNIAAGSMRRIVL